MSSDLGPAARKLLEQAKLAQMRAPQEMRELKARVKTAVLAGVAADLRPDSSQSSAQTSTSFGLAKLWGAGLLIALVGGALVVGVSSRPAKPQPLAAAAQPAQAQTAEPMQPTAAEPVATTQTVELPEAPKPAVKRGGGADLSAEMAWLARAEAALRERDAERALRELRAGRTRFARGQLQAERQGLELIAECMLGRDVSSKLAHYMASTPDGVLVARVERACSVRGSAR